jgi:hypothetical protein
MAFFEGPAMNDKVFYPVVEGIKDSFRLSAGIVLAVGAVLSDFTHHSLSLRDPDPKPPNHDQDEQKAA